MRKLAAKDEQLSRINEYSEEYEKLNQRIEQLGQREQELI